jgi:hypothetical protein
VCGARSDAAEVVLWRKLDVIADPPSSSPACGYWT